MRRGEQFRINILRQRLALEVHAEDRRAAAQVRVVHLDAAVEASRSQQRRVEHVRPVGGGDENHARVRIESVHLHQQLVEGLFPFVVTAAQAGKTLPPHRINFINEHDARAIRLGLLEQVAHAGGAHADEHLHEFRTAHVEERHPGLAGDGAGEQRLAAARRADQQDAARNARAQRLELARVLQELDHFDQFRLDFVHALHIVEGYLWPGFRAPPRAAAAEGHRLIPAALRLPHHEQPEPEQKQPDHDQRDHALPPGVQPRDRLKTEILAYILPRIGLVRFRVGRHHYRVVLRTTALVPIFPGADVLGIYRQGHHASRRHSCVEVAPVELFGCRFIHHRLADDHEGQGHQGDPHDCFDKTRQD